MIGHKGRQLPKSVSSNTGPALGFTTFGIFMTTVLKALTHSIYAKQIKYFH